MVNLTKIRHDITFWVKKNPIVILTFALVIITFYYAISTHNMTSIMKQDFESNNRPFVFISDINIDNNPMYSLRIYL